MTAVNLNADLGESFGPYTIGNDAAMLELVRSANLACGFHGGDPLVMADTIDLCGRLGVSIGAHPGFADLQGFGRRPVRLSPRELEASIAYQVGALQGIAAGRGQKVTHIKPHGAMNNMASEDIDMARVIAKAVKAATPDLIFVATTGSRLAEAGYEAGLNVAEEVFADRTYTDTGHLTPRSQPNAMIHDGAIALENVLRMVTEGQILSTGGKRIPCKAHTICVHGDEATALAVARQVRNGLEAAGLNVTTLPEVMSA